MTDVFGISVPIWNDAHKELQRRYEKGEIYLEKYNEE